jgi:hypothetical protein
LRALDREEASAGVDSDWAKQTAAVIRTKSPLSLKLALAQVRRGKSWDFDTCMRMEFRIVSRIIHGHDFYEGVRAVIVDKDNRPRWRRPRCPSQRGGRRAPLCAARRQGTGVAVNRPCRTRESCARWSRCRSTKAIVFGGLWTRRLVLFLRAMATISLIKGLYHWAQVIGISFGEALPFENHSIAWQTATVFFAVIDLVAAVGLWLAAAWGAVIWLTLSGINACRGNIFSAGVRGGWLTGVLEGALLILYLWLALKSAQEHPQ